MSDVRNNWIQKSAYLLAETTLKLAGVRRAKQISRMIHASDTGNSHRAGGGKTVAIPCQLRKPAERLISARRLSFGGQQIRLSHFGKQMLELLRSFIRVGNRAVVYDATGLHDDHPVGQR